MLQVRVREADNARDLASSADETDANTDGPRTKAVYELTALVAHIMGDAEEQERLKKKRERAEPGKAEGHIVAHIKASHPRHPPPPPPQTHTCTNPRSAHGAGEDPGTIHGCRDAGCMAFAELAFPVSSDHS